MVAGPVRKSWPRKPYDYEFSWRRPVATDVVVASTAAIFMVGDDEIVTEDGQSYLGEPA